MTERPTKPYARWRADWRDTRRTFDLSPERVIPPRAAAVLKAAERLLLDPTAPAKELAALFTVAAIIIRALRRRWLRTDGWRVSHSWKGGPGWDNKRQIVGSGGRWFDHTYVTVAPQTAKYRPGERTYVSEPYQLGITGLRQLLELEEEGYSVTIDGCAAHYPGRTLRVALTRRTEPRRTGAAGAAG